MKPKYQRSVFILLMLFGVALSVFFFVLAFKEDITFFYTPSEMIEKEIFNKQIRLGGLVKENSVHQGGDQQDVYFDVTDFKQDVTIHYQGILPNLFREGQGIVAQGRFENNIFEANEVLAKHDESYRPPALEKKLEENKHLNQENDH